MVPKGWSAPKLGDFMDFKNGINTDKSQYGSGVKFVNVMDVFGNDILKQSVIKGRVQIPESRLRENLLQYGDILFNRTSETFEEIAMSAVYLDDAPATFGGFVIRGRDKNQVLDPNFSVYVFQSNRFRQDVVRLGQGAVRANIGQKDLSKVELLVPPRSEQKKIAQILSTWDKAITTTEQLLANSQQQKKALMQQLLTGKKRLLDENGVRFSGEWKRVALGDVFQKISNGVTYDAKATEGLPVSRIETISTGTINYDKVGWAPNTENTKRFRLHAGDILYSHINSLEHIGRVAYFSDEQPLFHGMNLLLLRAKSNQNSRFYYYLLGSDIGKRLAKTRAKSAVNQASISTTDLKMYFVYAPSFDEQEKIASVLSVIDEEVSKLQQKLEALKQEKKALMQQLLTGKRRVKVDEEAA